MLGRIWDRQQSERDGGTDTGEGRESARPDPGPAGAAPGSEPTSGSALPELGDGLRLIRATDARGESVMSQASESQPDGEQRPQPPSPPDVVQTRARGESARDGGYQTRMRGESTG